jgi:DNA-binding CsgD family transcriptional regulator/tetratricopeptide (TPR) repeat protein
MNRRARLARQSGDLQAALDLSRRALHRIDKEAPSSWWHIRGVREVALALNAMGRYREAASTLAPAFHSVTDPPSVLSPWCDAAATLAWSHLQLGELDEAETIARSAAAHSTVDQATTLLTMTAVVVLCRRGKVHEAQSLVRDLETASSRYRVEYIAARDLLWPLIHARAEVSAFGMQDPMLLSASLSPLWEDPELDRIWGYASTTLLLATRAETSEVIASGSVDATAHLDTMRQVRQHLPVNGAVGAAWEAELEALDARLTGEDTSDRWRNAVDAWLRVSQVYDAAVCSAQLADALAREGDPAAARQALSEGLALAEPLGARPLVDRMAEMQRRWGWRRADDLLDSYGTPLERLTSREREVLTLVAQGLTNREISHRLYMSPKTASVHVSRILAKLGLTNRTQIAALAHRSGLLGGPPTANKP